MHSRKGKFDAIFWVSVDTEQKLAMGFAEIAQELALLSESESQNDVVATREIVKCWFSESVWPSVDSETVLETEVSWLVIFDNADDPDLLNDYWPAAGHGSILVTSRDPWAKKNMYANSVGFDLPPMPNHEAGTFLHELSDRTGETGSLELCTQITGMLGGLPLAIMQMGGIIRRQHLSLEEFFEY
jgi:NB-ARC domain